MAMLRKPYKESIECCKTNEAQKVTRTRACMSTKHTVGEHHAPACYIKTHVWPTCAYAPLPHIDRVRFCPFLSSLNTLVSAFLKLFCVGLEIFQFWAEAGGGILWSSWRCHTKIGWWGPGLGGRVATREGSAWCHLTQQREMEASPANTPNTSLEGQDLYI